jgi:hypothetical protein
VFEAPGFRFAVWQEAREFKPGVFTLPHCLLTAPAAEFVSAAYAAGWVLRDFDWPAWKDTPEAVQLRNDPDALEQATVVQLARLLTVLIRQDRFVEGALANAYDSGLVIAILRRADALRMATAITP